MNQLPNELIDLIASFCPYRQQLRFLCDAMKYEYPHITIYPMLDEIRSWDRSRFNHMDFKEWHKTIDSNRFKLSHRRLHYGTTKHNTTKFAPWYDKDGKVLRLYDHDYFEDIEIFKYRTFSEYIDCGDCPWSYEIYAKQKGEDGKPFHWEKITGPIIRLSVPLLRYSDV